ncbi:MAG TPA: recombination mediator RecR [Bacilli bacterium]|nr:recombination mediator RecR [Bacilli bacterium]
MNDLKSLQKLIEAFQKYPGVGPKTASRMAFFTIDKFSSQDVVDFQVALAESTTKIRKCKICGMLTEQEICSICRDITRNKNKIMVVESAKNVIILEETKQYNGVYHVLYGVISPLDGIGPDDINIKTLEERITKDPIEEIILATSLTALGDTTASYLAKILKKDHLLITRIGYGLPAGGDIDYADEITLKKAIEGRKEF